MTDASSAASASQMLTHLKVEPTNRCNFDCPFCIGRHQEQGGMPISTFEAFLALFPAVTTIELVGEGEPLLWRHFRAMHRACLDRGIQVETTSNGSAAVRRHLETALEMGLTALNLSLESLAAERYRVLRPGGELAELFETLSWVMAHEAKPVHVRLWVTLLRTEYRETLQALGKLTSQMPELQLEFQTLNPMPHYRAIYPEELLNEFLPVSQVKAAVAELPALGPAVEFGLDAMFGRSSRECRVFDESLYVDWKGRVTPCCLVKADTPGAVVLGQTGSAFSDIQDRLQPFRSAHRRSVAPEACRGCPEIEY